MCQRWAHLEADSIYGNTLEILKGQLNAVGTDTNLMQTNIIVGKNIPFKFLSLSSGIL